MTRRDRSRLKIVATQLAPPEGSLFYDSDKIESRGKVRWQESASKRGRLAQSGRTRFQRFRRWKDQTWAADGKVEFFLLRLFDMAAQIRKMADVAQQFDLVLFDMVLLHQRDGATRRAGEAVGSRDRRAGRPVHRSAGQVFATAILEVLAPTTRQRHQVAEHRLEGLSNAVWVSSRC